LLCGVFDIFFGMVITIICASPVVVAVMIYEVS